MTEESPRRTAIKELIAVYRNIWGEFEFIHDEHARARACNLVMMDKRVSTPEDILNPFNPCKGEWVRCPHCGAQRVTYKSKDSKEPFQACFDCRIWLKTSGEIKNMDKEGAK